jgi:DNA polymerase (family 10)
MKNSEIAEKLYEIADFYELQGVEWKPRAYRRAAGTIETLSEPIEEVYRRGELEEIAGVGEGIAEKIEEYLETESIDTLEKLREDLPEGLRTLMEIEGIGPKTAKKLYNRLGITSIDELEETARNQEIRELEGFGEKMEEDILEGIEMYRGSQKRFLLGYKLPNANEIVKKLRELSQIKRINLAGSIRRRRPTIGDVDILITVTGDNMEVMDYFTGMDDVKSVRAKGPRKSTVILRNNLHVDLMIIEEETYGAALQYFTGNKAHNIKLRNIALDKAWKLSEYGLVDKETENMIAGETEGEIYEALGLQYIPPELRTDRGEIEAAQKGELPALIEYDGIQGDLHTHSDWSEGSNTIEEMANAAKELGHEYIALCDHSKTLGIASGLNEEDYRERQKEIDKINEKMDGFKVLSGTEVEIDSDGSLDLKDKLLKDLDFVIASIHSGFRQSEEKITNRLLSAMSNDHVNAIGHPTGRLLQKREGYQVDLTEIYEAAQDNNVLIEINAFPTRLDLPDSEIMKAREYDIKFSIGTDSHNVDHLRFYNLGISNARRGWLEKEDIINTLSLMELKKELSI